MHLEYHSDLRDNDALRASFNALTRRCFGFDFADWYARGWWADGRTAYTPHALVADGQVVANISATRIDFDLAGERLRATQLGTVMTAPEWRGQGLQRRLMEQVLRETADSDMVYLYANDAVTDFYPRFGFSPATEHACSLPMPGGTGSGVSPFDPDRAADCEKLLRCRARGNPFSAAAMEGETGLLMFYCTGFLRDCVFFLDDLDAAAVAEYDGDTLLLHELFCPAGTSLSDALCALARPGVSRVTLGFTPGDPSGMVCAPVEEDGGLFVLGGRKNPFALRRLRLPTLSHT